MKFEISHDTLAKQVFEKASSAVKERRKAKALIERAFERYKSSSKKKLLSKDDYDEVKPHLKSISFSDEESDFLLASKKSIKFYRIIKVLIGLGYVTLAVAIGVLVWRLVIASNENYVSRMEAIKQARLAVSNDLIYKAELEPDRSIAFRLAEMAHTADPENPRLLPGLVKITNPANREPTHITLIGHDGPVLSAAFAKKSRTVITGSLDMTAKLWDMDTGKELKTFVGHIDNVRTVAFSPDEKFIATGSKDGTARIWDVESTEMIHTFYVNEGHIRSVKFSPDGNTLYAAMERNGMIKSYDVRSGRLINEYYGHKSAVTEIDVDYSNNLYSVGHDGFTLQWLAGQTAPFDLVPGSYPKKWTLDVKNGGNEIVTGDEIGEVSVITYGTSHYFKLPDRVMSVKFFHNNPFVAAACWDGKTRIWDYWQQKMVHVLEGHTAVLYGLDIHQSDDYLATTSDDGTAKIWKLSLPKPVDAKQALKSGEEQQKIFAAALSDDHSKLAISTYAGSNMIRVIDTRTEKKVSEFRTGGMIMKWIGFSHDQTEIYSRDIADIMYSWNIQSGEETSTFQHAPSKVTAFAQSSKNDLFAFGTSDGLINIIDRSARTIPPQFRENHEVRALNFSSDGKWLAAGFDTTVVIVYNIHDRVDSLRLFGHFGNISDVEFSPDGSQLLSASIFGTGIIWGLRPPRLIYDLQGQTGEIVDATYSPNGNLSLTASLDGTVKVWDARSGEELFTFEYPQQAVKKSFLHSDNNVLVTVTDEKIHKHWLNPDSLINQFKSKNKVGHLTSQILDKYRIATMLGTTGSSVDVLLREKDEEKIFNFAKYFEDVAYQDNDRRYYNAAVTLYDYLIKNPELHSSEFYSKKLEEFKGLDVFSSN